MENIFRCELEKTCEKYKKNKAISYLKKDESIDVFTYKRLLETVQEIEEKMKSIGVKNADRVAIISPHSPYGVMAGTALAYMGCTAVMIDAALPIIEIIRLLEEADVVAAFIDVKLQEKIGWSVLNKYPIFDLNGKEAFRLSSKGASTAAESKIQDQDEEIIAIIFSSGTTSKMKGICIPYQSIMESISMYSYLTGVEPGDRYLYVLPFNHIAGYSGALQHLLIGCELDMMEEMDSVKLSKGFQIFQPHYFAMIPKVYEIIAEKIMNEAQKQGREKIFKRMISLSRFLRRRFNINIGKKLFHSVRSQVFGNCMKGIGVGASPCKKETADFFLALGYDWANFYSSTETGVPAVATGIHDGYPDGTVGNIYQFQKIDIQLINVDKDGVGEIAVKSPLGMKCYFRNEELTKKAFNDEGYVLTGDLGQINSKGYLRVVGRTKEVIILHNGKKVSPFDIEEMYASQMEVPVELVCCGIKNDRDGYDEIHLFIEQTSNAETIAKTLKSISNRIQGIYKVEQVHIIPKFPKTAVGKIKRSELVASIKKECYKRNNSNSQAQEDIIKELICRIVGCEEIGDVKWTLQDDLQMDSLQLFELAVELEKEFGMNISSQFGKIKTVEHLLETIKCGVTDNHLSDVNYDINDFPIKRVRRDYRRLHRWINLLNFVYQVNINGQENIPGETSFLLAANHTSNLDPFWMLIGMRKCRNIENVNCLAAQHTMKGFIGSRIFRMLGSIPVHREGNTVPVLERAKECLDNGSMLIIFPEGARSRDGSMLPFKEGCAQISWKSKKCIVPVCIQGGYEIFPRQNKLPHLFDWKKMHRYCVTVTFCKPIQPSENYEEVTGQLKKAIEKSEMK